MGISGRSGFAGDEAIPDIQDLVGVGRIAHDLLCPSNESPMRIWNVIQWLAIGPPVKRGIAKNGVSKARSQD